MHEPDPRTTQHFGFLLLPRFALMSYAAATEPLRAANLLAGTPLYCVTAFSADGAPVRASNGLSRQRFHRLHSVLRLLQKRIL